LKCALEESDKSTCQIRVVEITFFDFLDDSNVLLRLSVKGICHGVDIWANEKVRVIDHILEMLLDVVVVLTKVKTISAFRRAKKPCERGTNCFTIEGKDNYFREGGLVCDAAPDVLHVV